MLNDRNLRAFDDFMKRAHDGSPRDLDLANEPQGARAWLKRMAQLFDEEDWAKLRTIFAEEGEEHADDEAEPEAERQLDQPAIDRRNARAMDAAAGSRAERSFVALFPDAHRTQNA
jgi:hypothetical protein